MKRNQIGIVPSAGEPKSELFPNLYDSMIPINGKPTIHYIIDKLISLGIKKIFIILNKDDILGYEYLNFKKFYGTKIDIFRVKTKNIGETLSKVEELIGENDMFINFGDCIFFDEINLDREAYYTLQSDIVTPKDWTYIDENLGISNFSESNTVLNGVYNIKHSLVFFEYLKKFDNDFDKTTQKYFQSLNIKPLHSSEPISSVTNTSSYQGLKIKLLRIRGFNSLSYDTFRGTIKKKSSHISKIKDEIEWYRHVPEKMNIFFPRFISCKLSNEGEYELEYYGYPSLADTFLYGGYSQGLYKHIIRKLFDYIFFVQKNYKTKSVTKDDYYSMYYLKTLNRVKLIEEQNNFSKVLRKSHIKINGKNYVNTKVSSLNTHILSLIDGYQNKHNNTFLHGDFCFSNILFDPYSGIFKIIDPRGRFGKSGIYGDLRYDVAKLRHSLDGNYEKIIADLFSISYDESYSEINFTFFNELSFRDNLSNYFDEQIKHSNFDINEIKFIEGLLFLTMIPLHSDNEDRQLMMYCKAIIIFNELGCI